MADALNTTDYLPWTWTIRAIDPNKTCPSSSQILGTFAWVNIVVSLASAIVGHRAVTLFLTRVLRRHPKKEAGSAIPFLPNQSTGEERKPADEKVSRHYYWTWIFPFALGLGANAVNAYLMRRADGYETNYSILKTTLFLTVRPRLGVVFVCVLDYLVAWHQNSTIYANNTYRSAAISSMFAELGLQGVALYTTGRTVRRASQNHYLGIRDHARFLALPSGIQMMYGGMLVHVNDFGFLVFSCFLSAGFLSPRWKWRDEDIWGSEYFYLTMPFMFLSPLWTPYIACWVFLAGYVKVAGDAYCPPDLVPQGGVWASFSVLGMLVSAGELALKTMLGHKMKATKGMMIDGGTFQESWIGGT